MFKIKKIKQSQLALSLLCLVAIVVLLLNPQWSHTLLLDRLDYYLYDRMLNQSLNDKKQATQLVIIDIDDYSVQQEGRWPWPRDKLVNLIDKLKKAGVALVGFDIIFSEQETNFAEGLQQKIQNLPPDLKKNVESKTLFPLLEELAPHIDNDKALANAFHNSESVLGYLFQDNPSIKEGAIPKPLTGNNFERINTEYRLPQFKGFNGILPMLLEAASSAGFVTTLPDSDGVIRHAFLLGNYEGQTYANFALAITMRYLMADTVSLVVQKSALGRAQKGLKLSGMTIPTNSRGQILVPFFTKPHRSLVYSAADILKDRVNPEELSGSIAIVGSTMVLLSDLHLTPVAQNFAGVEMVANMVSGIISQQLCREYEWNSNFDVLIFIFIGLVYAVLFTFLGPTVLVLTYLFSILAFLSIAFLFFVFKNIYIPTALLLLLITLQMMINFSYNFILERRQKNKINLLFGQYLPPSHIKELLEAPENFMEEDTRDMTVSFSDIRNFTSVSEALAAKDIKRLLNAFFTPVTEIIFNHYGTVDKYVGDMIMAFWGAPTLDIDHAHHGVAAALEIQANLPAINETLVSIDLPALTIGTGISSGMMNVGDMGSAFRRSYTVLGDAVNLASRLQDLTKYYGVPILVSYGCRVNQDDFLWRSIDKVAVKGRRKGEMIYAPIGYYLEASQALKREIEEHELALTHYFNQNWVDAMQGFEKLKNEFPETYIYEIYITRIEGFIKTPPPKDWDGTFYFSSKEG